MQMAKTSAAFRFIGTPGNNVIRRRNLSWLCRFFCSVAVIFDSLAQVFELSFCDFITAVASDRLLSAKSMESVLRSRLTAKDESASN